MYGSLVSIIGRCLALAPDLMTRVSHASSDAGSKRLSCWSASGISSTIPFQMAQIPSQAIVEHTIIEQVEHESTTMSTTTLANESTPVLERPSNERQRSPSPRRSTRHTKGLSLNFPILLPTQYPSTGLTSNASPVAASHSASPNPNETAQSPSRTSADFLTLVAAQERRVLELKEELLRADAELTALKKQWAIFEANKKREEARQLRRLPVPLDEVPSPAQTAHKDLEEEWKRRRALVEMSNNTNGSGRRGSKRVFEGRHTRTLSLLSPTSTKAQVAKSVSIDELVKTDENRSEGSSSPGTPSLSRMATFDDLVSPDLQVALGKTYKNIASQRRSLPPGTADFMKQGRQVVDGVREGLWTFFEDIRQATVGDEAVNGPVNTQQRHARPRNAVRPKQKSSKSSLKKEESFWREFGIETPRKPDPELDSKTSHGQKSSTDTQNPPSLLEDLNDDDWDNWESPISTRQDMQAPLDSEGLPWPELKKQTPSKLTRTVSDLMREWHDGEVGSEVVKGPS